ncbi:hypothetical protein BTE77_35835 [Ensifer adhaerens]|nr:hypothetical protein BTE77_35835 [Ensifer adhaerens]
MLVLGGLICFVILLAVLTALLRWLWNTTFPELFGFKTVSFWQALRILLIAIILLSGPFINLSFGW